MIASGAIFVMLFWPEAVAGPSFQLSFAAVTAIVALHEHRRFHALVERRAEGLIARFCRSLLPLFLTGIAVELTLSPISFYPFPPHRLSSPFANILTVPLTPFFL